LTPRPRQIRDVEAFALDADAEGGDGVERHLVVLGHVDLGGRLGLPHLERAHRRTGLERR
jgi:hypothetical protein